MSLLTVPVTCIANDAGGNPVAGALFSFQLVQKKGDGKLVPVAEIYNGLVAPEIIEATADENGIAVVHLFPNALGQKGSQYWVLATNPDDDTVFLNGLATIPNAPAALHAILEVAPIPALDAAQAAVLTAQEAASATAAIFADALGSRDEAVGSATAAAASEDAAAASQVAAESAANTSTTQAATAIAKAAEATTQATIATTAAQDATDARDASLAAQGDSEVARDAALDAQEQARIHMIDAGLSANTASVAATAAGDSAVAAGTSADAAASSADAAHTSSISAAGSATGAAASRTAIDNRLYPGAFAAAPATRPDGSAIQNGDQYLGTDGYTYARIAGAWVNQTVAAAGSATAAAASQAAAATSATSAATSQGAAATSATNAANYAAAAATGAKFFDTVALGNAGVADGATFGVKAGGSDGLQRPTVYRRDAAGAQTLLYAVIPGAEFDSKVSSVTPASAAKVPLVFDAQGNVAVWLDAGALSAKGLSSALLASIQAALSPTMTVTGLTNLALRTSNKIPLAWDDSGNVALWLDGGQLACAGVAPAMISAVSAGLGSIYAPLKASRSAGAGTLVSDGRFLRQYRAKRAMGGVIRVLLDGDSWIQNTPIPQALLTRLAARFGASGAGWLSSSPAGSTLAGVAWNTYSGWTILDYAQPTAQSAPARGCGIDGFVAEATGTAASASVTLRTETFRIFYWDGTGTFRYRVDGGAWTAVAGGNTGVKANVLISGLSDANHTIEIDTATNAGTVTLHGFQATRSAPGIELSKCGNGDQSGRDASIFASQIAYFANLLAPDVVFILLGTNEVRFSRDVPSYVQGLTDKVTAYRSANPGVGIVIGFPAQCGSVGTLPESAYRDAGLAFAQANSCEWFSGFDLFDTYTVENARGQWNDPNHLNAVGAMNYATSLDNLLLGV